MQMFHDILNDRRFALALAIAASFRILVFFVSMIHPFPNELGLPTSPLDYQTGTDFAFYERSRAELFDEDIDVLLENIQTNDFLASSAALPVSRPVLPLLLQLSQYRPGNTLPLATIYLFFSLLWAGIWMAWLKQQGLHWLWVALFGLIPNPVWFTLNISADFPFAVFVGGFFLAFLSRKPWWAALFMVLALLTRPNGLSLIMFCGLYFTFLSSQITLSNRVIIVAVLSIATALIAPFLWSSLQGFSTQSGQSPMMGYSQFEFLGGIYSALPLWLDLPLSWLSLLGVKTLYVVGLRPSFGDTNILLVLIRGSAGLILLPGLIRIFVSAPQWLKLFLFCILLPIFTGIAQERYILPVLPLLFVYGVITIQDGARYLRRAILGAPGHGDS